MNSNVRPLLQDPDPILYKHADLVTETTPDILSIVSNMTHYLINGLGGLDCVSIAAPQVGESIQLIIVQYGNEYLTLINPKIIDVSDKLYKSEERCLSVGGGCFSYFVNRHKIIKIRATLLDGKQVTYKARDDFGKMLQHEIDHLYGIMINMHPSASGKE